MYIKTADLASFRLNSSMIETNDLHPILAYLHLEDNVITKYNLESFVSQRIDTDNKGVLLIEERIINNFLDNPESDIIQVTVGADGRVTYAYSPDSITWHGVPGDDVYPKLPESDCVSEIEIDAALVDAMKTASKFVLSERADQRTMRSFVMVGEGLVTGTDGMIAYFKKISFDIPRMILTAQQISIIGQSSMLFFSELNNHIFFRCGAMFYGFVKPEQVFVDMNRYAVAPDKTDFQVTKSDLLVFNDRAAKGSLDKNPKAIMRVGNNEIIFELDDATYSTGTKKRIVTLCNERAPYKYLIPHFGRLVRALEGDTLFFTYGEKKYFITTDDSFVAMMIEME